MSNSPEIISSPTGKAMIPTSAAMFNQLDHPGAPTKTAPPKIAKKMYTTTKPIKEPVSGNLIKLPNETLPFELLLEDDIVFESLVCYLDEKSAIFARSALWPLTEVSDQNSGELSRAGFNTSDHQINVACINNTWACQNFACRNGCSIHDVVVQD